MILTILLLLVVFFFLSCVVAFIGIAMFAFMPYSAGNTRPLSQRQFAERGLLYFIALYPVLSLLATLLFMWCTHTVMFPGYTAAHFLFFGLQTLSCAFSVGICVYLSSQHIRNTLLFLLSAICGAFYLYMITFAFWIG